MFVRESKMSDSTPYVVAQELLTPGDPPVFEEANVESRDFVFFICDHASRRIPQRLGTLGLTEEEIGTHIGWDIGAADLARMLASSRDASLVLSGYSRLVIDCNRPLESPGSIPDESAGIAIPGNIALSAADMAARRDVLFRPYHAAIAALLDRRRHAGIPTLLFSMHSFTPNYPGQQRPWHMDLAYNRDSRLAKLLLEQDWGRALVVGDNVPYKVEDDSDYSIPIHGERRGLPHVLVEIRQDTLADAAGIASWAERFDHLLRRLRPSLERLATDSLSSANVVKS
ncbi:N-formylglutamate amidohydrolase [Dongia soli]|uniref:N-formylglutamate amidohydrolase n=1 Tax=Dongia soli TaxID=600628 RepID=A0ABU5EF43_9PROT|nr:N-formylglutamate amidohydrolase [Dongia soli]MDY0884971.1 N-formylglutamate amidohydrolase [Dongia soli]